MTLVETPDTENTKNFTGFDSKLRPNDQGVTMADMYRNISFGRVIDEAFYDELNKKMARSLLATLVYLTVLMAMGVVGNTMVFLVYYKRFKPSATRTYVLAMSVFDLLANVASLPGDILDIRFFFTFDIPWLCRIVRSVSSFLTLVSAFILVAVARDRHRKICHPLQKQSTPRQIAASLAAGAAVAVALTIPFAVLNGRTTIATGVANVTGVTCSIDDAFQETIFPMAYNAVMGLAFISCVAIMVVSYAGVGRQLWQHRQRSQRSVAASGTGGGGARRERGWGASIGWQRPSTNDETTTCSAVNDSASSELPASSAILEKIPLDVLSKFEGDDHSSWQQPQCGFHFQRCSPAAEVRLLGVCSASEYKMVSSNTTERTDSDAAPPAAGLADEIIKTDPPSADATPCCEVPAAVKTEDDSDTKERLSRTASSRALLQVFSRDRNSVRKSSKRSNNSSLSRTDRRQGTQISRSRAGTGKKIPKSTTLMMFVLTAVFVINYLPHLLIIIARAVSDNVGKGLTGWLLNVYNIALRSYFLNCAVNPVVYSFCSAKFRRECRNLVTGKVK